MKELIGLRSISMYALMTADLLTHLLFYFIQNLLGIVNPNKKSISEERSKFLKDVFWKQKILRTKIIFYKSILLNFHTDLQ